MPFTARTYTCGDTGGVRKLVDLAGSWIDVSLPANGIPDGFQSTLLDIEADPNNGDKVFVVGEGYCSTQASNWYGIAVSSNAGASWQVPTGNYQTIVNNTACYHKWIELSVVDSNTIYVCGIVDPITKFGTVAKSVDGGITFNKCAQLPLAVKDLDCTSIHFITPLIGVVGLNNYVVKTTDGGSTWTVMNAGQPLSTNNPSPGTLLPIGAITGIYMTDDQTYIVGIGLDFIVETVPTIFPTAAGLTTDSWRNNFYTNSSGFNSQSIGYHLSYLKKDPASSLDDFITITGFAELGIFSFDRGASWNTTPAPGYQPSGSGFSRIAAHYYKSNPSAYNSQAGFYSKNGSIYANPTGFDPNVEIFSETSPYGINAIWTWYQELPDPPPCYRAIGCDGEVIITTTDLSAFVLSGVFFTVVGYSKCFYALNSANCNGAISLTLAGPTYSSCQECDIVCFLLQDCAGVLPDVVTDSQFNTYVGQIITLSGSPGVCWQVSQSPDCVGKVTLTDTVTDVFTDCVTCSTTCYTLTDCLGQFPEIITNTDISQFVGLTVQLLSYPGVCWTVAQAPSCRNSIPLGTTVTAFFQDCESCLQKCYKLVDCSGVNPDRITNTDLSAYIGKVIKIKGCPDTCWTVFLANDCTGAISIIFDSFYVDCPTCFNVVHADVILTSRSVYPNYGNASGNCSIEYMEKVNCNFSEQIYSKMIAKRYGIKSCEEDLHDKYWVKKHLLDLDLIHDPSLCKVAACCLPCGITATLVINYSLPCPAPTNVITEFTVPVNCPAPEDVVASVSF